MQSHPVRPPPLCFGLYFDPSLYVLYVKSKGAEEIYICTGLTKSSLFTYPHIGFFNALLFLKHKKLTLLHTLHLRKLIGAFGVPSVSACTCKVSTFYLLSEAEPGHILFCVAAHEVAYIHRLISWVAYL